MKQLLVYCFLSCWIPAFGQPISVDSLKAGLAAATTQSEQLHWLEALCDTYEYLDLRGVIRYGRQGIPLALEADSSRLARYFLIQTGRAYANTGVMDSALLHFKWARREAELHEDLSSQASANLYCQYVYAREGHLDSAMDVTLRAMELFGKTGDSVRVGRAMVTVSEILARQEDVSEAIRYARDGVALLRRVNDSLELAFALEQLGYALLWKEAYDEALIAEQEAILLFEALPDLAPVHLATAYNNLGNIYKNSGQHLQALKTYEQSERHLKNAPEQFFQSHLDFSFCNILIKLGRYEEALERGAKALVTFEQDGMLRELPELYLRMSQANEGLGNYEEALMYFRKSSDVKDSLFREDSDARMLELQTSYETKEKEAKILQLEKLQRQQRWLNIGAFAFGGLLLLFVVVLVRNNRRRQHDNELLNAQNVEIQQKSAQNELLLKEIHHRVKNNLQTISSLLFLQSAHIHDEEVKQAVSAGQNRVESMALIHQKLYQRDNLAAVEMKDYFMNLAYSLFDTFGMKDRARLNLDMEALELDVDKAVPLGLIVNELITNSLKYAFPDGREGSIRVALRQVSGEGLVLEVEDDGVGAGDTVHGTAFGSQLVTLLSQQLGGHIQSGNQSPAGYKTRLVIGPKAG